MNLELGGVIALIALVLVIAGHLCTTVWWMSKITTTLEALSSDLKEAVKDIKGLVPKVDCIREHEHIDKRFDDIWKKLDEIK